MQEVIKEYIKKSLDLDFNPRVDVPVAEGHGHYSTNLALQMAKEQGKSANELAHELVKRLSQANKDNLFFKIEVAGGGFVNFWLSRDFLLDSFLKSLKSKEVKGPKMGKGKKIIIDYSQPNIAKRMHIGHLRSTIIGDALANVYDFLGYKSVRWNYYGDWGTQFGKLIAAYRLWGSSEDMDDAPIETLLNLYVRFHSEIKTDPALEDKGRLEFKKLEDGDRENQRLWAWFKEESLKEFNRIYDRLGIHFDVELGEAYYQKSLKRLIKELRKRRVVVESEGALVIPLGEGKPPALVQKSDGATLYMTRDIACLGDRLKRFSPKKILYVVSNEQTFYFTQLFAVAEKLGLNKAELIHVKFGLVLDAGKKLSTREGGAVRLEEVMNKTVDLAYKIVSEKNPDLSEEEKVLVAEKVGIGALKYNDLRENRGSDVVFDWNKMLDLRGDTAPYLQYTTVRLRNIIRKSEFGEKLKKVDAEKLQEESELALVKRLIDFNDVVKLCGHTYLTSPLAKYLFGLAQSGNRYYEKVRILKDEDLERKKARVALVGEVVKTLEKGLEILGVQVPERI